MATRNQSKKLRLPYFGKSPSSVTAVPVSQPQSQPNSGSNTSGAGQSGHDFRSKLIAWKRRLTLFRGGQSSSPGPPVVTGSAQGVPQPPEAVQNDGTRGSIGQAEPDSVQALAGGDVDIAHQAFERIVPIARAGEIAVNVVARADAAVIGPQDTIDTYLKPLKLFNNVVTTIANVHPYAQPT
ncbi:hypothetical protein EDD15DRAFT_2324018 [Pisolithus albus]|nr:hypothetical protein EDD15DRAFT_2324018 [Pisolithus albus]